jgi:hypothetical protein
MRLFVRIIFASATLVALGGCTDLGDREPGAVPAEELLHAPDTVSFDGKVLYLATALWRDFQPVAPPSGRPLIAVLRSTTADISHIPASVSADAAWIVYSNRVWAANLMDDRPGAPYELLKSARDGPLWGPNVFVDVVVRVSGSAGTSLLLRAPHQLIARTD